MSAVRQVLASAAGELDLEVVSYCDELNSGKGSPRYLHANVREPGAPSPLIRLKVANPERPDYDEIRRCCRYANQVHRALVRSECLEPAVDIPAYWDIPRNSEDIASCSEWVDGHGPTADDLPLVVDALIQISLHRARIKDKLARSVSLPSTPLNYYGYREYRSRLCFSLQGLLRAQAIGSDLAANALGAFDQLRGTWPRPNEWTFVHGDFAFGNVRLREGRLVLIDFEHSHIGLGEIDFAHLYVNLAVQQDAGHAERLLQLFQQRCEHEAAEFAKEFFHAAVLERVAGKMNAMSDARGNRWEALGAVLVAYAEGAG